MITEKLLACWLDWCVRNRKLIALKFLYFEIIWSIWNENNICWHNTSAMKFSLLFLHQLSSILFKYQSGYMNKWWNKYDCIRHAHLDGPWRAEWTSCSKVVKNVFLTRHKKYNINSDRKIVNNFFLSNYILIIIVKKLNYIKIW